MQQRFTASKVTTLENSPLIAFGDPQPSGALRHSLVLSGDEESSGVAAFQLEFNDHANTCRGDGIKAIELSNDHLRISFKPGCGIHAGTVGAPQEDELSELDVTFALDLKRVQQLASALAWLAHDTKVFRYTGSQLKR